MTVLFTGISDVFLDVYKVLKAIIGLLKTNAILRFMSSLFMIMQFEGLLLK